MGNNSTNQSSTVQQEGTKLNPGDESAPGSLRMAENVCHECKGTGKLGDVECPTARAPAKSPKGWAEALPPLD